jgi:lysozyme family protein
MKAPPYGSRWPQLAKWWEAATITNPSEVAAVAKRLVAAKARYQSVEAKTGVPWWLIAAIHQREASQNWNTQLAQGDPLNRVSTHEPKGMGPYNTWEEGAIAALKHDGLTSVSDWRLEKALHWQEKYNGWGYFYRGIPSSYVWGATSVQRPGKYVADGVWSSSTMDRQIGCAAMLKGMMAIDPSIKPMRESAEPEMPEISERETAPGARPGDGAGVMRGTGAGLLRRALEHIGEEYVNIQIPKDDPNWKGPWDCAEFTSWLVFQETGILYGCVDNNAEPAKADAYTGAWRTDAQRRGIRVSVEKAAATVGGIVLRYPPASGGMGHIALCDGKGGTVEAMGRKYGVVASTVHGRRWHTGVLIPGIKYDSATDTMQVSPPAELYARDAPNMDMEIIKKIQGALASKGFSPGAIDGEFGPDTEAAVVAFQLSEGLVADGEVGRDTAAALGISLAGEKPVQPDVKPIPPEVKPIPPEARPVQPDVKPRIRDLVPRLPIILPGLATMNPFIALAGAVLPDILKAVVGDKAGTVAGAVKKVVTEITRTEDPEEAQHKLETDPAAVAALQLKLAEIAAEQEEKRQQAQLALLKEQNEQEAKRQQAQMAVLKEQNEQEIKRRDAQLAQFKAEIEDTKGARSTFAQLALANNPMAWGAPVVSLLVTVGFFGILTLLIFGVGGNLTNNQIINITVGALAAAFATVVSFWLGSSQGSRQKDVASIQLQAEQTESQVKQAEVLRNTMQAQAKQTEALQATVKTAIAAGPAAGAPKPSNFRRCLDIVLGYEGGFSAEPGDPSGATQFGIGIGALRDFRGDESLGVEDLKSLGRDEACEIYRTRYWNVLRCDDLPTGVDLVVFDFAVDTNTGRAARTLQQVVGAEADGSIGDATLAATKVKPARDVVKEMSGRRLEYYRALPDAAGFIRGAIDRANAVEKAAVDMIPAERTNGRV